MCGISGVVSREVSETQFEWLANTSELLCHRGPDGAGEWWSSDRRVGLAHRRLAILDLSDNGFQPMQRSETEPTIIFNGEIYNHSELRSELRALGFGFASGSDTEVLLAAYQAWGHRCLDRLNGMFAFAIYDQASQTVFLARDRAGEKPLFYYTSAQLLIFASELGVLLKNPDLRREINPEALNHYLAYGYSTSDNTLVRGIHKLPPAHAMLFHIESGLRRLWPYWELPKFKPNPVIEQEELVDELDILLEAAVKRQLEADVPVGVLLSGGLDSSLITAMASRGAAPIRTFTVAVESDTKLDEARFAESIAAHFGTEHTVLPAETVDATLFESIAKRMGEPLADSSIIPTYLVTREIRKSCTVALGGDGGDELFGGYGHYSQVLDWSHARRYVPGIFTHAAAKLSQLMLPVGFPGRNLVSNSNFDLSLGVFTSATHFDSISRRKLLRGTGIAAIDSEEGRRSQALIRGGSIDNFTAMDFANYLPEDILVKVDRASMMNSLEVRAPFLDASLLEFAFGRVPSDLKATRFDKKILLKRLAQRLFPKDYDFDRKQGFSIPLAKWLKQGDIRDLFWDTLAGQDTLLNKEAVLRILNNQERGFRNSERIFALFQLEIWRREFDVSLG